MPSCHGHLLCNIQIWTREAFLTGITGVSAVRELGCLLGGTGVRVSLYSHNSFSTIKDRWMENMGKSSEGLLCVAELFQVHALSIFSFCHSKVYRGEVVSFFVMHFWIVYCFWYIIITHTKSAIATGLFTVMLRGTKRVAHSPVCFC